MIAWIIYFRDNADYNAQYIQYYMEEGKKLGITVRLILVEELEYGVRNNQWFVTYQNKEIEKPDFIINRTIYPLLSKQFEYMGIPVFNNSFVSEICNDKARTYQHLARTGISMIDTCFYKNTRIKELLNRRDGASSTVIKSVDGHGGQQVFLLSDCIRSGNNNKQEDMIQRLGHSDVVVQPLIGGRHQDLRVYVIGTEIIAAVLRTAKEGFKSNFSLGGDVRSYELSPDEIEIVQKIINEFEFGLVGIDFIIGDKGELIFNEIEDVVGSRMLYRCSDINIVELYLKHILKNIKSMLVTPWEYQSDSQHPHFVKLHDNENPKSLRYM